MSRSFLKGAVAFLPLITLMVANHEASAQMRRSPFGTSRVSLATLPPVQNELKLNDEQKGAADKLHDQLIEDRRGVFQRGGGDWDGMRKEMEKLDAEATAKFNEKLDDGQKRRLTEIYVQANGPNALADTSVMEILELTDDQKGKLDEIRQANRDDMFDAFRDLQSMSEEERRETMDKLREDADTRLLAALTDKQREAFAKLPGEVVDYDLSALRGAFPGRGGGARGARPTSDSSRPQRPE
jgi:hypothetical protein